MPNPWSSSIHLGRRNPARRKLIGLPSPARGGRKIPIAREVHVAKAKRRGSRPGGPGGQSNRGSTTVTKPAPATPGGPNRQVRKEEARRERERLQRKVTRRRLFRWVAIGAAVVILAAGITGFVIYQNGSLARAL